MGNDIVDLTDPANIGKSGDCRFLQRVFTTPEQQQIAVAAEPDVLMWALWAGKETAYKIIRKSRPDVASTPRRYEVTLSPPGPGGASSGYVCTPLGPVAIRVSFAGDYLHCIGTTPLPDLLGQVIWQVERLYPAWNGTVQDPSIQVRHLLSLRLAELLRVSPIDIGIRRVEDNHGWGPPILLLKDKTAPYDLSLTHDGAFAAYALLPSPYDVFCPDDH